MLGQEKTIYLDHHATTPVDPEVVEAMLPYFTEHFGNPSGTETASGRRAAVAVSTARQQVAELINADPAEIVFTSGATEANNLAILGTLAALQGRTSRRTVFTTPVEHKAVLAPFEIIARKGFRVVMLPVTPNGRVNLDAARTLFNDDSLLLSVQLASNEIGTIQPLAELVSLAHEFGALVHTDAAQAVGKMPIDIASLGVDLLSLSAHKFYGPKGVGALYLRNGPRSFPIRPRLIGGAQEQGLRAGTINVPGVVGLGEAANLARKDLGSLPTRLASMRDTFESLLLGFDSTLTRNGDLSHRLPNNSSITFSGIEAQVLIQHLPELELSSGSACTSGAPEPSHVLQAIGLSRTDAYHTLRFGWGKANTLADAHNAARSIMRAVAELRQS
jgi:cysteine desulfurase